jgi:hypothetical protein
MDETQRRKISAKEFLEKNRKVGLGLLSFFLSLFILYFAFVFFYVHTGEKTTNTATSTQESSNFLGDLLPVFEKKENNPSLDEDFLNNFANPNKTLTSGEENDDTTKIIKVEEKPIAGYTVFDKPISIKNYIKNKPKICSEKLEPVLKKEEKSTTA